MGNEKGINGVTWKKPSDELIYKIQKLYDSGFGRTKTYS